MVTAYPFTLNDHYQHNLIYLIIYYPTGSTFQSLSAVAHESTSFKLFLFYGLFRTTDKPI
jgi:hypothetical protein